METGRSAIGHALRTLYPGQEPLCLAAVDRQSLAPLEEVRVYRHPSGHWHYTSYGLSELGGKESADATLSGWGIELTFRLHPRAGEQAAPRWPALMLQQLASYVYKSTAPFAAGHDMDLGGPVDDAAPAVTALAFTRDAELGEIVTPNGTLTFVQAVGLRANEKELLSRWSISAFLEVLEGRAPLLVTDLERPSLLDDPELGPLLAERAAAEGTPQTSAFAETLSWRSPWWSSRRLELFVGPVIARRGLAGMLAGRTDLGREFRMIGPGRNCLVRPGASAGWTTTGIELTLTVSPAFSAELRAFLAGDGLALQSRQLHGFALRLFD